MSRKTSRPDDLYPDAIVQPFRFPISREDVTYLSEDVSAEWVEGAAEAAEEVLEEQDCRASIKPYRSNNEVEHPSSTREHDHVMEGEGAEGSGSQAEVSDAKKKAVRPSISKQ
eukprot:6164442-Amphidinium_carterae.1